MSEGSGRASTIAAAAATLTAIVAVVVAVWDNVETRKHNRLSVLPYVVLERIQHEGSGGVRGEITVSNEGVGPAKLRGLEIGMSRVDGGDTVVRSWGEAAPLIRSRGVQIRGWMDVDSGSALGVQRDEVLLTVQAEGEGAHDRIQAFLDDLRLRLRYGSVYGDAAEAVLGDWPGGG